MPASLRKRSSAALPVLVAAATASSLFASSSPASAMSRHHRIGNGLSVTRHQKGDPYHYGSDGPRRFDCSGLVYYSYRKAGFRHVPRSSSSQAHFMNRIKKRSLRPGDFVFIYSGGASSRNVYHVGVFAGWRHGHGTMIDAPHSGSHVHRERIWTHKYFAGTLRGL
jgi:cell wall-associated NlpC family hydrolase